MKGEEVIRVSLLIDILKAAGLMVLIFVLAALIGQGCRHTDEIECLQRRVFVEEGK